MLVQARSEIQAATLALPAGAEPWAACQAFAAMIFARGFVRLSGCQAAVRWLRGDITGLQCASACTVALLCCASGCAPAAQPKTVRRSLSVLLAPNQFPALSGALEKAFSASLPGLDIRFIQRDRGIDFVKAVQAGDADISFLFADSAYLASVGELDGKRYDRLRGIAVLDALPLYIVVRGTSDIHTVEGLRNQRVSVGAVGSGMATVSASRARHNRRRPRHRTSSCGLWTAKQRRPRPRPFPRARPFSP